jgi:hypothetical protein
MMRMVTYICHLPPENNEEYQTVYKIVDLVLLKTAKNIKKNGKPDNLSETIVVYKHITS